MSRSIDVIVGAQRPADTMPRGRLTPEVEPEDRSFETRSESRGSKVDARRVNGLPRGMVSAGRTANQTTKSWKERLQLPLIIIGGMLAGFAIQSALLGQALIVAYGVACLIYRIPSRISFGLALAALSATTGLLVLIGNVVLSQTFATYTFLLLVVGVISLNRELKREGGRVYSRRPRI